MKNVTVRNLSDEVHRAIRIRAAEHGRSTEAEIRAILTDAVQPPGRIKLGTQLAEIWATEPFTEEEHAQLDNRDRTHHEPMEFGE
ncbi:Arc family DNA-binding protein [Gordonia sp. LSe1-13]|uniref:Arc family DNA-binding protein n=2 Tax=Gordonia TaxID=2053 RepID=A0ABU7MK61_9ACTN|nr:Arc family DNA-binding protein [Gordonia sp. LSe1-13]MEE4024668.1 Arc family DNA-binding protein [Gordonia sp. PKS22-38]